MKKIRVGFSKKEQGVFDAPTIKKIKDCIQEEFKCDLIEVDFRKGVIMGDKVFVDDLCLNDLNIYFWHDTVFPREWCGDNYYCNILKVLEKDVRVINTGTSVEVANDKFLAHKTLREAGLPVGDFALAQSEDVEGLKKIFNSFGKDVLLKPRFGGWGLGIIRVKSLDDLMSSIEYMSSFINNKQQILIERFYENDISKWISLVVFGNKVLFGYQKPLLSKDVDWKIYDPLKKDGRGQKTIYIDPPQELIDIALLAKQAINKDIIGFDFIHTKEGYKIIDENGRPGLYEHCLKSAGINITNEVLSLIKSKM